MIYFLRYSQKNPQNTVNRSQVMSIYSTRRHTTKPTVFPLHNKMTAVFRWHDFKASAAN